MFHSDGTAPILTMFCFDLPLVACHCSLALKVENVLIASSYGAFNNVYSWECDNLWVLFGQTGQYDVKYLNAVSLKSILPASIAVTTFRIDAVDKVSYSPVCLGDSNTNEGTTLTAATLHAFLFEHEAGFRCIFSASSNFDCFRDRMQSTCVLWNTKSAINSAPCLKVSKYVHWCSANHWMWDWQINLWTVSTMRSLSIILVEPDFHLSALVQSCCV